MKMKVKHFTVTFEAVFKEDDIHTWKGSDCKSENLLLFETLPVLSTCDQSRLK